jgi:hypothetical protein
VCRQLGVSEATFYIWKKKYAHLGVSELRKLRSLEDENARLKRVVADLTLDKHMLAEALKKRSKARTPARVGRLVSGDLRREGAAGLPPGAIQSHGLVSPQRRPRTKQHFLAKTVRKRGQRQTRSSLPRNCEPDGGAYGFVGTALPRIGDYFMK